MALDLNNPQDAKAYVRDWVKRGNLRLGTPENPIRMEDGSDQDFLRVAYQLFLFCDEHASPPPLNPGEYH
jgi:hypothetical protein